jgi:transposase
LHNRKNSLFAGHDLGAEGWAMISSLLETAKLNRVNPQAWLTDVLTSSSICGLPPESMS